MGPDLLPAESLLGVYRDLLSWPGVLMTWMGGLLVALSALGAILYIGLLWEHRKAGRCTSPRRVGWTPSGVAARKKTRQVLQAHFSFQIDEVRFR
ncbi:MAG: hypothetical protein IH849_00975 [Acidobacteria bacterium]|nr:hypothetical protein [Acidobacteriota bacterium]